MKQKRKLLITINIIVFFQFKSSCMFQTETCQEGLKRCEGDYCNLYLTVLENNWGGNRTDYTGISLDTGKVTRFKTNDTQYLDTFDYIEMGDTLKKNRGTSNILLLKKDSVIVFKFYCENEFTETKLMSFKRPLSKIDLKAIDDSLYPRNQ